MGPDPDVVLQQLTEVALRSVRSAHRCGVLMIDGEGHICAAGATDDYVREIQQIQQRLHQGPCLHAASRCHTVRVDDIADEQRWPRFSYAVIDRTPARSLLSVPLEVNFRACGALSWYSDRTYAFDARAEASGHTMATDMMRAWQAAQRQWHAQARLDERDMVNRATGILMERHHVDADAARVLLARMSERAGASVASVAEDLVGSAHSAGATSSAASPSRPQSR